MLTIEEFNKLKPGVFASGILPNSPEGLFMTNTGGELLWVAVKGYGNDWKIYTHWSNHSIDWVADHGDKVHNENHIKKCVPCDEEVFKLYLY